MISVCIINRNYPPRHGATGYQAYRLIHTIKQKTKDISLHMVTCGTKGVHDEEILVRPAYEGRRKAIRFFAAIIESILLIRKAKSLRPDVYIVMTDPPLLSFFASKMLRNQRWILWCMDIYPDAFVASGLVTSSNPITRYHQQSLRFYPPDLLLGLGEKQIAYLHKYYSVKSVAIPVGLRDLELRTPEGAVLEWYQEDKVIFGYLGSLGEAHDDRQLISLVRSMDPDRHLFVMSLQGVKDDHLRKELYGLSHVYDSDYIHDIHCKLIDIQIVSLLPHWTHICVPSKALSALQYGSAVLFIGSDQSDTWGYVKEAGWICPPNSDSGQVLVSIDKANLAAKRAAARKLALQLSDLWDKGCDHLITEIRLLTSKANKQQA